MEKGFVSPASASRVRLCLLLFAAIATACISLPVEHTLRDFLLLIKHDLGTWGPDFLAVAYDPLTILAFSASIFTLGVGYLFGLPVAFILGATLGATAAYILGRTIVYFVVTPRTCQQKPICGLFYQNSEATTK